ncbi:MAG: dTMP kinase [Anaerolineae bacterium]
MARTGVFITFEGPEGGGKTTQSKLLAAWLREQGYDVLLTREPGGTRIGDAVRAILLSPEHTEMQPQTEILLFSAARAQLVREVIRPCLAAGKIVLCDRFADSTLAYQGYGRQLDLSVLRLITAFATGGLVPDLTICPDLPVAEGLSRKLGGDVAEWNRMEQEEQAFHQRVREGFLALAAAEPDRWLVVDALQPINRIQAVIRQRVDRLLARRMPQFPGKEDL